MQERHQTMWNLILSQTDLRFYSHPQLCTVCSLALAAKIKN